MRRTLGYVGIVFTLSLGIGATFHQAVTSALFTTQSTNPSNTFQAGTLRVLNSRDGAAVFSTSTGMDSPANPGTSITVASGSMAFGGLAASGTMPYITGPNGPLTGAQALSGLGGMAPGTVLVNSLTIGNVGTLSAGGVRLSVPSVTVANWPAASCDASTTLLQDGINVCGRGRLTDVLRVTAWYAASATQAVCVLGANRGTLVTAATDSESYVACAGPYGLGEQLTIADSSPTLPFAPTGEPDGTRLTLLGTALSGARVVPTLAQGVPVLNYRNGAVVSDWEPGRTRAITFAVAFDPAADNRYAGAQATVDLRWNSVSLTGAPSGGVVTGTIQAPS